MTQVSRTQVSMTLLILVEFFLIKTKRMFEYEVSQQYALKINFSNLTLLFYTTFQCKHLSKNS